MKKISTHNLKQTLSSVLDEARSGAEILITRHNKPVARLAPPDLKNLHQGSRFGKANLKPVLRGKTGGRYLRFLQEDRRNSRY